MQRYEGCYTNPQQCHEPWLGVMLCSDGKHTHKHTHRLTNTVCTHSAADNASTQTLQASCWLSDASNGQTLCAVRLVECVLTASRVAIRVVVGRHWSVTAVVHGGLCVRGSRGSWGSLVCIVAPRLLSTNTEMMEMVIKGLMCKNMCQIQAKVVIHEILMMLLHTSED